jgi:hypothetical protein
VPEIMEVKFRKPCDGADLTPRPVESVKAPAVEFRKDETRSFVLDTLPSAHPILMLAPFQEGLHATLDSSGREVILSWENQKLTTQRARFSMASSSPG